jgi:hypothetical protein
LIIIQIESESTQYFRRRSKMKKLIIILVLFIVAIPVMIVPTSTAQANPLVTITLLNPPPDGLLELEVGESHTFDIEITSDDPFVLAMAMTDAYYPGRGVFWHGSDRATRDTYALLHLTVTGKNSTSDLGAVCDWPDPGRCWTGGVAPLSINSGVRFKKGIIVAEIFPFSVRVP